MRNLLLQSLLVFALASTVAPAARSQQDPQQSQQQAQQGQQQQNTQDNNQSTEQPTQPIPAYHSPLGGVGAGNQNANPSEVQPDTRPLAGAQQIGLGTQPIEHSYWQPTVSVYSTFDSNSFGSGRGWINLESFLGSVELHRESARNDLTLVYAGGGTITSDSSVGNTVLQQLQVGDKISLRRAEISFFNSTTYIPEAAFGYGGLGGVNLPGTGMLGLGEFVPEQSILAARDQRVSNADLGQVNYRLSRRTSVTLVGGYSLLHFLGGGYFDFREPMVQAGYNYQWTRNDTIALLYRFDDFQFNGLGESIRDNRADLSYGRRVTGRAAFQVQAGPEAVFFNISNPGTTGSSGTPITGEPSSQVLWNLNSSVTYAVPRGTVSLSYSHGVNGGSGVLVGAVANTVQVSATRALSREFAADARFGYARNTSLNGPTQLVGNRNYNYLYGGADLSRAFGRYLTLILSYQYQRQTSTVPVCIGTDCGTFTRNLISVGVTWQDRPLAF
ncbi:MAG TPA: hypothetical protein VFW94_20795 [Candidatus Acidoferrales bacterium]|nr:hypothetical protein [Candidatus Acidoferrales bacterium]